MHRAAIEFLKSNNYNLKKKDTPSIFFAGNSISGTQLSELLELPQIHTIGQLENLLREQIIYTGTLGDYVTRFSHGPIDFFERRSRRVVYWQSGKALCRQAGLLVLHGLHRL